MPLSSFCCDELGFRFTLLENEPEKRRILFAKMADGIREFLMSCHNP